MTAGFGSYSKVYNLGHREVQDVLKGDVVVQEKVDGSQFSFGVRDGVLHIRSKGAEIIPEAPPELFRAATEAVLALHEGDSLAEGWTYRAEAFQKPKHNNLAYDRVPTGSVILFDVDIGDQDYLAPAHLEHEAKRLGLESVRLLYEGPGDGVTLDHIGSWMYELSNLGGSTIEGVVIKNYALFDGRGKTLMGKHVSEKFKEQNKANWKVTRGKDIQEEIGQRYRSEPRWAKAVLHLREAGTLTDSPKDIGPLILEIQRDVEDEELEAIKDRLWEWARRGAVRKWTAGFPEWYKQQLLEKQFANQG